MTGIVLHKLDKVRTFVLFLACVVVFGVVSGCVKLERPTLDRKYFTFDVERQGADRAALKTSKNLIVRRVKVSPRYEDKDLVYKKSENIFEADYYNAFFVPPAAMITQELRVWMDKSMLFANVLGPDSMGTGDLLLEGGVNSVYGDYSGENTKAVLEMQFFLLDNADPDMPIVYSRSFSKGIPVNSKGSDALVKAMNAGLTEIFTELEEDLAGVIRNKGYASEASSISHEK